MNWNRWKIALEVKEILKGVKQSLRNKTDLSANSNRGAAWYCTSSCQTLSII
jgi:hypothetical protein